jgi:hypothetical protein
MAVKFAIYLFNHLPNPQKLCPADIIIGNKVPMHRLLSIHVWGCPVYVLDKLQAGQKIPAVFDDHFTTVSSIGQDNSPPNHWADLCLENSIPIVEDQETSDKSPMSLNDEWLTTEEMLEKQRARFRITSIQQT